MQEIIAVLSAPWVGTILGAISLVAAIYFYLRSKRVSRLAYQIDELSIVGSAQAAFPNELEIRYAGTLVPRVTATRLVLWNAGNVTLRGDQVVASDPLRLELPESSMILSAAIVRSTREANAAHLVWDERSVTVTFDYFDPNDGVTIEVYHSGGRQALKCVGTLRGLPSGPSNYGTPAWQFQRVTRRIIPGKVSIRAYVITVIAVGILLMSAGIFNDQLISAAPFLAWDFGASAGPWLLIALGGLYLVTPVPLLWRLRKRYPISLELSPEPQAAASVTTSDSSDSG